MVTSLISRLLGALVGVVLLATSAQAVNVLGYPSDVAARVTYERTNNTAYGLNFNAKANRPWVMNNYDEGDYGGMDALMYRNTGNVAYAIQAAGRMSQSLGYNAASGCNYDTGCNLLRDQLGRMVIEWSQICGNGGPGPYDSTGCADLGSQIDAWASVAMHQSGNFGLVYWDSDELVGFYLGLMLYAAAIENDNPTRANAIKTGTAYYPFNPVGPVPLGWLNSTISFSYRNILRSYTVNNLNGATASDWFESSMYNLNTDEYLLYYTWALNNHYGVDYFPEITSQYNNMANYAINELASTLYDRYQWGDEQNARIIRWNNLLPIYMMLAKLTTNPTYAANLQYLINAVFDSNNLSYWDPFGTFMDSQATRTAPSGVTTALATGLGTLFWHSGWTSTSTFFASQKGKETGAQHSPNRITSWILFRNGNWAVRQPIIYNEEVYLPYANGTMPLAGGFSRWSEAWQEALAEVGSNYSYHVGVAGGAFGFYSRVATFPEDLHEFTNTTFSYHHADGSDTVIDFDRVNARFPADTSNYYDTFKAGMGQYNSKHVYKINAENQPTCSGTRCSWNGGSETVYLDTFMPSKTFETPSYINFDLSNGCSESENKGSAIPNWYASGGANCDTRYQARIIDEDRTTQHQVFINTTHVGNTPTTTELTASAGEVAKGVKMVTGTGETLIYIANAANRTSDLPTPTATNASYNPNRFNLLKILHFFKTGTTISFTTSVNTPVFIADIDPSKTWTLNINGAGANTITPSAQGVYSFNISSGSHTIVLSTTGAVTPACSNTPSLCSTQTNCQSAGYCWEDRGSGNACYITCSVFIPPEDCSLTRPDLCTNESSCTAITGLYWCQGACSTNSICAPFAGVHDQTCVYAYNFNQTSGHFTDQSLKGLDTQSETTIAYNQSGVFGNSIYCDETNSLITIPYNSAQDFSTGNNITITFWAKDAASVSEAGQILAKRIENYNGTLAVNYGVYRDPSTRKIGFYYNDPSSGQGLQLWQSSSAAFSSSTWKYFMITYTFSNAGSIHIYVGDTATALTEIGGGWIAGNGTGSAFAVPVNTTICGLTGNTGETYKGNIDELAVFNKILSQDEGNGLRQNGAPPVDNCANGFLNQCTTEQGCVTAGGYWYNNICNVNPLARSGTGVNIRMNNVTSR